MGTAWPVLVPIAATLLGIALALLTAALLAARRCRREDGEQGEPGTVAADPVEGSVRGEPEGSSRREPDGSARREPEGSSRREPEGSARREPVGSSNAR